MIGRLDRVVWNLGIMPGARCRFLQSVKVKRGAQRLPQRGSIAYCLRRNLQNSAEQCSGRNPDQCRMNTHRSQSGTLLNSTL